MSMRHSDIAAKFAAEAGKASPDLDSSQLYRGNLYINPMNGRQLLSYGTHFVLAEIMGDREWWLLNADTYSVSTSRHQSETRSALAGTGLPMLLVPFSCLREAEIIRNTIVPVDIRPDRTEKITHTVRTWAEVPESRKSEHYSPEDMPAGLVDYYAFKNADGLYQWTVSRHWLGDSLFKATYNTRVRDDDGNYATRTAYFLSSFDYQESQPLYFLAELPQWAEPTSVEQAIECLKPDAVKLAEAGGLTVTRQGDVFAVPTPEVSTSHFRGHERVKGARILGVNHTATESVVMPEGTYARGILRHSPEQSWRAPEHKRQRMGDGKTWHYLVKNTVPASTDLWGRTVSRSWSRGGRVD